MNGALAKRYARALAAVAREAGTLEAIADELSSAAALIANPELGAALGSPTIETATRDKLLAEVASSLGLSELTQNFLSLLLDNERIGELPGIDSSYRDLVDRELGRVRATLQTARPLPDASTEEIRQGLSKASGRDVLLSSEANAELVGGVTVEIEGRVYDGSVRTKLVDLARTLARGESA